MLIGVDFDNTIVCYDQVFPREAVERGLVPAELATSKTAIRDYLRKIGQEDRWTELQGIAYGPGMQYATPFPGAVEFFHKCRQANLQTRIISHRTQFPYLGEKFDLHQSARNWLTASELGVPSELIFFELTKAEKLARIRVMGCTHFIDDLPEFLADANFPRSVHRILFDPGDVHEHARGCCQGAILAGNQGHFDGGPMTPEHGDISALLTEAGARGDFTISALPGGGNNRVYRVDGCNRAYLLKSYFQHPDDPRDRLGAEFAFLKFAWDSGIRSTPQPFRANRDKSLGLYEFVDGTPIAPNSVGSLEVSQALEFFLDLNNAARLLPESKLLGDASEACFSMAQHTECVDRRIARLDQIDRTSSSGMVAADIVKRLLIPSWITIRKGIGNSDEPLAAEDRRLSPSDFGFHNALNRNGNLVFLDFEYAGWDDPAKTVCDFFCQPAIPVPIRFFGTFARRICQDMSDPKSHLQRIRLLLPLYRIKWCCIMLNEFLPVGGQRRSFAREGEDPEARRKMQLEKVSKSLDLLEAAE